MNEKELHRLLLQLQYYNCLENFAGKAEGS